VHAVGDVLEEELEDQDVGESVAGGHSGSRVVHHGAGFETDDAPSAVGPHATVQAAMGDAVTREQAIALRRLLFGPANTNPLPALHKTWLMQVRSVPTVAVSCATAVTSAVVVT
jgi:hypothetical protein